MRRDHRLIQAVVTCAHLAMPWPSRPSGNPDPTSTPSSPCAWGAFAAGVVRIVAIVVGCGLALYVTWRLRDVVPLMVISVFLALALIPVVDAVDRRARVPRAVVIIGLYVFQPLVYGRALDVDPIVTILAVLAGSALLGILGALLAIPVAAAIQIILRDWWANRAAAAGASQPR